MASVLPFIERDINGISYKCYTLNLKKWCELTELLASLLGEPIASLLRGDAALPQGADVSMSSFNIPSLIAGISGKITSDKLLKVTSFMGQCLHCDDRPLDSNKQQMWWPNHMKDLAPCVVLFLEAQYSDFFEGINDSMSSVPSVVADQSERVSD